MNSVNFGHVPGSQHTNPGPTRAVLDALEADDTFTVYYDSGHMAGPNGIWHRNTNSAPFPKGKIHSLAGTRGDKSLFGWAVRHYSSGWLICDDGPGEAADFRTTLP